MVTALSPKFQPGSFAPALQLAAPSIVKISVESRKATPLYPPVTRSIFTDFKMNIQHFALIRYKLFYPLSP